MELTARLVRIITSDVPIDPGDPGGSLLVDEGFDGGQDGEFIDVGGISSDSIGGTLGATLSHSDVWQLEGGYSLHIAGTDAEWARWEHDSHDEHYTSFYYYHEALPGENAYIYYLYAANGSTVALRIGITSGGLVYLQDSTTGTGAADDLSPALTLGEYYRFDLTAGHGAATLSIYDSTAINEVGTALDWDTLTITLTATAFSDEVIGLLNTLATGGAEVPANLITEYFEGAANAAPASSATTTADTGAGSGTLTHSTTYAAEGTRSLRVNGTANHTLRWTKASRANTFISLYLRFVTAPGTSQAYLAQVRTGDNAGVGFQFGVQTDGRLRIRDSTNGTGAALDSSTAALTTATNYRIDISALGAGDVTLRYYTGANIDSTNTADAVETMSCTCAATDFGDIQVGLISSVTTACDIFVDRFKADDTALPSPLGVTGGGAAIGGFIERFKSDSMIMPAPLSIVENPNPDPVSGLLVPETGVWWGSSTPVTGGKGTSEAGLAQYETATGGIRPHILHLYQANWNGTFNAAQNRMLNPGGGAPRKIPLVNWKPGSVSSIPGGGANNVLDTAFTGMTTFGHKMFVTVWHEYENNFGSGPSPAQAAEYVNMFRYVVQRYRDRVPQSQRNVIWVVNWLGYRSFGVAGDYELLYPGDDVVDWIAWDPYGHTPDDNFAQIVNDPSGAWTGFYDWATTPQTLPASGSRPTNFSGAKPLMMAETGIDLNSGGNGKTDAAAAAVFNTITNQAPDYPNLKAIVYWNGLTANGDYQIQRSGYTQTRTAVQNLLAGAYFQQDTSVAN